MGQKDREGEKNRESERGHEMMGQKNREGESEMGHKMGQKKREGEEGKEVRMGQTFSTHNSAQLPTTQNKCWAGPKIDNRWILDSGATDTMTYDIRDLRGTSPSHRDRIETANGNFMSVDCAGTVEFTPRLKMNNCLLIPSLTHKLLSISQLTKELHCTTLMSSDGCLLQDTQTGRIIGHGTEKDGLYYLDEVTRTGQGMPTQVTSEDKIWMWHRRLGHPSLKYLRLLFPSLKTTKTSFLCETCALAKSKKNHYKPSLSHKKNLLN